MRHVVLLLIAAASVLTTSAPALNVLSAGAVGHHDSFRDEKALLNRSPTDVAIQMNDVDIDHRGLAYAVGRVGTGLFILEYTGQKPHQVTSH